MKIKRRNYPKTLKSHKNEIFELVGMSYEDYLKFCETFELNENSSESKKSFFDAAYSEKLVKKNNKLFLDGIAL